MSQQAKTGAGGVVKKILLLAGAGVLLLGIKATPAPKLLLRSFLGAAPSGGQLVPYRGFLSQAGGPVTTNTLTLQFDLYDSAVGGNHVWGPEMQTPSVVNGNFSVNLGAVAGAIPDAALVAQQVFVGISVGGQTLQGRQQLLPAPYARLSGDGVPPGTIVAFGGEAAPVGWLPCDGRTVSGAPYVPLCAALGSAWGTAASGSCVLPNLTGAFLRGAHADGGIVDSAGDRAVGSREQGATAIPTAGLLADVAGGHSHTTNVGTYGTAFGSNTFFTSYQPGNPSIGVATLPTSSVPDHTHSVVGGDPETRPANFAVNYIIKL